MTPTPRILGIGIGVGVLGTGLWLARWLAQGESAMWTDLTRRFWVSDPEIGWIETTDRWVWLGLEGLLATLGVVVGTALLALLARRARAHAGWRRVLLLGATLGAVVACAAPVLPLWAFLGGMPPDGAMRLLPTASDTASKSPSNSTPGTAPLPPLPVPAGAWHVLDDARTNLLAVRTAAGDDTFDTTFGPLSGAGTFDPTNPAATRLRISVPAASLATGIALRDTHAQKFIEATQHAAIVVTLTGLDALHAGDTANARRWTGRVTLSLMGADIPLAAHGSITARTDATILVEGGFELPLSTTRLDPKDFDTDRLVVTTRFVLQSAR